MSNVSHTRIQPLVSKPPKGWAKTNLGSVVWSVSDKADPTDDRNAHYVGLEHIRSGEGQLREIGEASEVRSTKNKFLRGDILYGKLRPYLNKVAIPDFSGICSTDILVLRPEAGIEKGFVEAVLRTDRFIEFATKSSSGINLPRTSYAKIASYDFWLAPSKEQKRISHRLRRLLAREGKVREQLRALPTLIQQYRAAILEAACSGGLVPTEAELARRQRRDFEPATALLDSIIATRRAKWEADQLAKIHAANKRQTLDALRKDYPLPANPIGITGANLPQGWAWASLEQITDPTRVICYGILMPKADVEGGVPYVKVRDMKGDRIGLSSLQRTSPRIAAQYERSSLKTGDILLSIRGTYGRVVEVPKELEGGNITQDTARLAISASLEPTFVMWQLRSPRMQKYFQDVARGVAVKGVNIGDVRPAAIALPPLAEQRRIVAEVEYRMSAIAHVDEQIQAALQECAGLRTSFFGRALSGKLAKQDKLNEPVEHLLTRIEVERELRLLTPKRSKRQQNLKMNKLSVEAVRNIIVKLPQHRFSFDELIATLQAEYDPLKDIIFELLSESKPVLRQVFDSKAKTMHLERIPS